jgi:SAM-dependent methyltransferase
VNSASLLAINLYLHLRHQRISATELFWAQGAEEDAATFVRMTQVWKPWVSIHPGGLLQAKQLGDVAARFSSVAYLTVDNDWAVENRANLPEKIILPVFPKSGTLEFGLAQEIESHDYELGGKNEWNGSPTAFSPHVLRSLSAVHIRDFFPSYAEQAINELKKDGHLTVVDVGCGPISKLRWGALYGNMEIIGVDPLNDLYDVVIERHGLSALPMIRPNKSINAFAETLDLGGETFDMFYSCNALDHTQELERSFSSIRDGLRIGGAAIVQLNTREGKRQMYGGLHKYDCRMEGSVLWYAEKDGEERNLFAEVEGFTVERVYWSTEESFAFLLRRV